MPARIAPPISLAMTTDVGWPGVERQVRALELAAAEVGGELIVADGSGRPPPPQTSLGSETRWLSYPRASIYELRPALLNACRGELIALSEDYTLVEPGWAAAHLTAHTEFPDALAIGGPIDNLATSTTLDWASYFVVKAGLAPPVKAGPIRRIAHANASYKRAALSLAPADTATDIFDALDRAILDTSKQAARMDPRPIAWHDQSLGALPFLKRHFRAGRKYGAFIRSAGGRRPMIRLLGTPVVPLARLIRTARLARRSRHAERLAPALPWMLVLLIAQTLGQMSGILRGDKRSIRHD